MKFEIPQFLTLKALSLKTKMLLVLAVVTVGSGVLGYGYKQAVDAAARAEVHADQIAAFGNLTGQLRTEMLRARRDQEAFLRQDRMQFAEQHTARTSAAKGVLKKLTEHPAAKDPGTRALFAKLTKQLTLYAYTFNTLVSSRVAMGLNESSGARGAVRAAARKIEATLDNSDDITLSYSLLLMRRHEKNFLNRGGKKYLQRMKATARRFDRLLKRSFLPDSDKSEISAQIATYLKEFGRVAETQKSVHRARLDLRDAARAIEKDLAAATRVEERALATLKSSRTQERTRINLIFAAQLGLYALVLLAILTWITVDILKQLGADPARLVEIVGAIAGGKLDLDLGSGSQRPRGIFAAVKRLREQLAATIEQEIQPMVDAARNGDLSRRIAMQGKTGFYARLSAASNELVAVNEQVLGDTGRVLGALARGDLSETIDADYKGAFAEIKRDANATVAKLARILEQDVQPILDATKHGDLSQRIGIEDKEGFFAKLCADINEIVDLNARVVTDTARVFGALANGNLEETIDTDFRGEFARLREDANATVAKLTEVTNEIRDAAAQVNRGTTEIAAGNADLSRRTEEQASHLEETAAGMEEMTSMVKKNADNAAQANELAAEARERAERGGEVARQAVVAVEAISTASNEIADIIGVIDEIAFQTNLLALNASVEAARAGEQGRGFAVVASEVRNLAGRCATAAKEIKGLIQASLAKVEEGKRLVDESGGSLDEIVNSVKEVTEVVSQIASANHEQTAGIDQINRAITQIDEMTQRNAALVEEAAAASEGIGQQAHNLDNLISFFGDRLAPEVAPVAFSRDLPGGSPPESPWSARAETTEASVAEESPSHLVARAAAGGSNDWQEF